MRNSLLTLAPAILLLLATSACDSSKNEESAELATEAVSPMELPVSLRTSARVAGAVGISISPTAIVVDGKKVADLASGRLPDGERTGTIPALAASLGQGNGARTASLRAHVNTPYETTLAVLRTLGKQGISTVAFEVRKGSSPEALMLELASFAVLNEAEASSPAVFPGDAQRPWDAFVSHWSEMNDACRRAHSVDCDGKPEAVAEGGNAQIRLWSRGRGLKIEVERFGGPAVLAKAPAGEPVEMIEGVPSAPSGSSAPSSEPAVDGAFTWRFEAATDANSPISAAMRPLCGAHHCGVLVVADALTPTMRVVSFLGAAFPDGAPAPHVRFVAPSE